MRIEEVESFVLGNAHFVRIHTTEGITGLGQSACWAYPEATDAVVGSFRDYLVGRDPSHIEHHWQHMYRMGPFRGSILSGAVSAVDIALWDIKGKRLGVPVWQLLGGACRDRIRLHLLLVGSPAVDELVATVSQGLDDGYTAIKFDPLPAGYFDLPTVRVIAQAVERVAAVREACGDAADIIIELHRSLDPPTALSLIEALKPYRPLFVEDPIQIDTISSQADIARRTSVPSGLGERFHSIWEFRELLEQAGPHYVRADVGLAGGITHAKKIAAIAEAYHSTPVWHSWIGPVITAASAHLNFSIPNVTTQEYYPLVEEGELSEGFTTALVRKDGYLLLPEEPGLGVDLDEARVTALDFLGRPVWQIPMRGDGSVAFSV